MQGFGNLTLFSNRCLLLLLSAITAHYCCQGYPL